MRLVRILLVLLVSLPGLVSGEPATPALEVGTSGDILTIQLEGLPLTPGVDLYFADQGWGGKRRVDLSHGTIVRDGSGGGTLTIKRPLPAHPGSNDVGYEVAIGWTPRRLDISFVQDLPANSNFRFGVADIFLDRAIFRDQQMPPELARSTQAPLASLTLSNALGSFACSGSAETAGDTWSIRDLAKNAWRPAPFQTLSLTSVTKPPKPGEASHHAVRMVIEYTPSPKADLIIRASKAQRVAAILADKASPADAARVGKAGAAIATALADKPDAAVLAAQSHQIEELARSITASSANSFATDGVVIPQPQSMETAAGRFVPDARTVIVIPEQASEDERACATSLAEELAGGVGLTLPVGTRAGTKAITLSIRAGTIPGKDEAYSLEIAPAGVVITGNDRRGLFYGIQTFLQMLVKGEDRAVSARCATIRDWPDIAFRGMMLEINSANDFTKRTIAHALARHKFNHVILGESVSGSVRWASHPEIAVPWAMTTAQYQELFELARRSNLEPIPLIQTLGHCDSIIKVHPEFADSPDPRKPGNALCVSNPAVQALIKDVFSEVITLVKPRDFHIGLDEAFPIGAHPLDGGRSPDVIFADHAAWCRGVLRQQGIKDIMIWSDLLLARKDWPEPVPANSAAKGDYGAIVHPALGLLPKDLIIAYWAYSEIGPMPAIEHFQKAGFRVLGSSWYNDRNAYDHATAVHKAGTMGILDTAWTYTGLYNQITLVSVENAWSLGKPAFEAIPYDPVRRLQAALLPPTPSAYAGTASEPVALGPAATASATELLRIRDDRPDRLLLPEGRCRLGDVTFDLRPAAVLVTAKRNQPVTPSTPIALGRKARSLVFLHASDDGERREEIGAYTVRYANGSSVAVPLTNRINIGQMRLPVVSDSEKYKERGLGSVCDAKSIWVATAGGSEVRLHAFEWVNPHPELQIASVQLTVTRPDMAVLLQGLSVVE